MANPAARMPSMSSIIAELIVNSNKSKRENRGRETTYRSVLFPEPAVIRKAISVRKRVRVVNSYVYHGSITGIPLLSTFLTHRSQRTKLLSLHDVLSKQNRGSSKGPEVRANF